MKILTALALSLLLLTGCAMKIEDYAKTTPEFIPEEYFTVKPRIAHGQVIDRFGKVRVMFTTKMRGEWDSKTQTLSLFEDFVFSDGKEMERIWKLKKIDAHRYVASANDLPGEYIVKRYGQALHFNYAFPMETGGRIINTRYDDWMWLQSDGETILNRSRITKFGITLAEVIASFGPDK